MYVVICYYYWALLLSIKLLVRLYYVLRVDRLGPSSAKLCRSVGWTK